jgi:hypothetical protein
VRECRYVCGGRKGPHVFFPAKKLRNAPWEVVRLTVEVKNEQYDSMYRSVKNRFHHAPLIIEASADS